MLTCYFLAPKRLTLGATVGADAMARTSTRSPAANVTVFFTFEARRILVVETIVKNLETFFAFVTVMEPGAYGVAMTPWNAMVFCALMARMLILVATSGVDVSAKARTSTRSPTAKVAVFFTFEARRILVVGAMANVFETPFAFVTRTESVDSVLITPWNAIDFCAFTLVWLVVLVGCDAAEAMLTAPAVRPTLSKLATATRPKVGVLD